MTRVPLSRASIGVGLVAALAALHLMLLAALHRSPKLERPPWPAPVQLAAARPATQERPAIAATPDTVVEAPKPAAARTRAPAPRGFPPAGARVLAPDWPVEAAALPATFEARYVVRQGSLTGEAVLHWRRDADSYSAQMSAGLGERRLFDWTSRGAIDARGAAPERFVARGRSGQAAAANFQRGAGKITYAGPSVEHPLPPGAQDRMSALVQLAGIVAATPERFAAPGAELAFFVSGARGDADVWVFESRGPVTLEGPSGSREALRFVRDAVRPYDQRVEIWLDRQAAAMPLRMRMVTAGRESEALDFELQPP